MGERARGCSGAHAGTCAGGVSGACAGPRSRAVCRGHVRGPLLLTRHLLPQRSAEAGIYLLVCAFLETLATSRGDTSYVLGHQAAVKLLCFQIYTDRKSAPPNDGGLSSHKRAVYFTALTKATGVLFRDMATAQALGAVFEICVG